MKYQANFCAKTWYLHVWKISCFLHMWKDRCWYGYMINHTLRSKKNCLSEFHWGLCSKYNITWWLRDTKLFLDFWKYFTLELHFAHLEMFSTLEEKFCISTWPCKWSLRVVLLGDLPEKKANNSMTFSDATTGFPRKWPLRNKGRNSRQMAVH